MFSTSRFKDKHILVGITGCIAAYKTCYLIRYLVEEGAQVRAMMTAGAEKFITPLTIESLTNYPVYTEMFPTGQFTATHHIAAADWAETMVLAPATANIIGKLANGICDDFVSTASLAAHCPRLIAPAMNTHMWRNPALQRNLLTLEADGYLICPPEEGFLAEGYSGVGRLARLEFLIQYLYRAIHPAPGSLAGKKVLITAGPTREYLDPVRMFTNRATGKMGYALAWEAFARGAEVTLVHGPTHLTAPTSMETVAVTSAEDMYQAVNDRFDQCDIYISAAAIADYRPPKIAGRKIKKGSEGLPVKLTRTKDVLLEMSARKKPHQKLVGFSVETDSPVENARRKLEKKKLDLVVLNNPLEEGAAFAAETNRVMLITADKTHDVGLKTKLDTAFDIFEFLL